MFKLKGKIKVVNPTVQVSEKFAKRELVITTAEQYPQDIMFQFTQDKTALLDGFQVGQDIEVSFNLRGREWTSPQGDVKYFNTLDAWRVDNLGSAVSSTPPAYQTPVQTQSVASGPINEAVKDDDLPF
jgi:hypothetical protein